MTSPLKAFIRPVLFGLVGAFLLSQHQVDGGASAQPPW